MFLKPKGQSERNALESDPSGKTDGPLKGRFIQRLVYGGVTVFCCVAIIVLGIALLTKADPVVTTIGEDISTNDLFVAGLLDVTGDSQLRGNATVGGNLGVTGNADIGGTLGVTGDTTFSGNVDVDGNLSVAGTTSFGDAVFAGIDGIRYVDGVTYAQNGAGIQAAIDALPASGGKVILPAGTYSVSSTIVVNKSNVTLEGVGEATKLFLADGANVTVLQAGDGTNPYSGINILNLQIDGNRTNNTWGTRYGIYLNSNVTNSRIEKCYVREVVHSGIVVSSSNDNLVTDNIVRGVGSTGISVSTSYHDVVSANTVSGAGVFGIYLWSGEYGVVSGNSVNDNGMGGIGVYSSPGSSVTGNSVYSNDSTGILIDRISNGTSVSGNAVISNLGEGIKINRALDVTVDGNTVRLNGTGATKYNGIYVYSDYSGQPADRNIISDNILYGNGGAGRYQINLDGTSPTYINNNKVNDNNISVGTTGAGTINDGGTNTQIFGNFTGAAGEGIFDAQGNSALSILTVTQQGTGDIVDFKDGTTSVFRIADGGDIIMGGNLTIAGINDTIYVDGVRYSKDQIGIQNAIDDLPSTGGKVVLPEGTYNLDSNLDVAFAYAGGSFVDETTAANDATTNDLNFLAAAPQTDDAYYFGFDRRARGLITSMGTLGVGTWTIAWEYWNGSIWTPLTGVTDGSNGFTSYGSLSYTLPADWAENTVNSVQKYYIRARVSSFTSMTTAPKGTKAYPSYYVVVDKSGVSIEGVGEGTKISANGDAYIDIFACLSVSDVSISNMELDGNGYAYAVFLMNSSYSKIENNYIHDSPVSVYVYISSNNTITKNRIADTGGEGIRVVYGSSTNIISENMISGSGMEGIGMWGNYGPTANNYDNVIKNNVLEGNENGMWVGRWAPRTIISGNVIRNNLNNGINFRVGNPYDDENLRGSVIANNDIYGNAYDGIFLEGGWGSAYENINIESNTINANGYNGIELDSGKYITIKNNHIFDNSQSANNTYAEILIDSGIEAGNNIIEGNVMTEGLTNKAKYGIRESGTGSNNNIYANNYATGAVTSNISTQAANNTIYTNNSVTFSYGEKIDNATDGRIAVTGDLAPASNIGNDLGVIAMDTTADVTATGLVAGEGLGFSVKYAGDVNGDGYDDVINGSIWGDKAQIFYGGSTMDATADITITGSGDRLGTSVSYAGDVNGDGYDDVIVGAPNNSTVNPDAGQAYILFGGSSMDNVADVTMDGEAASSLFGASVSYAGDVNGDGYADVVIGADLLNKAYIFFGGSSMDNVADVTMTGEVGGDAFGDGVSYAGDVNGDGYADVIIGAESANGTGRAYVYYGGPNMNNVADLVFSGEAASDAFGGSVSYAGDVNGDGYDDIVIGARNYSSTDSGRAYVYYGGRSMDVTADVIMSGSTSYGLGSSVSFAGDINGDGYGDVIVGAIWGIRSYVYYGGSSMNNTADITFVGSTGTGFGGFDSSSYAGDVNNDGYADVVVGAPYYSSSLGRFYIYRGSGTRWETVFAQSANLSRGIQIGGLNMDEYGINTYSRFSIFSPNWSISSTGAAGFQDLNVAGNFGIGSTGAASKLDVLQNSASTALTVTQQGAGDIVDFKDGTTSVFKINDGGNIIMSGNLTTPSINNIIYVDGTKYAQDSTGIQAAIDALPVSGGKVILPAGTYNVTSTINIVKSDVTLEGAGDATKLFLANAVNLTVLQVGDGANAYSNVAISSLQVDGNKDNNSGSIFGIYFNTNVAKSRIENCYINNTANDALLIVGGSENVIRGNQIDSAGYDGILISGASKNIIEANKVIDSNTVGINLGGYGTSYNSVIGNYISGSGQGSVSGFGISVWRGNNNTITGNVLYSNLRHGIVTYDTAYNTIESNTLTNCSQAANNTYSAIYLQSNTGASAYSRYNLVSGNTIYESAANRAKYGIEENEVGSDYNSISNNVVNGAVTAAISTAGAHTTVAGNRDGSGTDALFDITSSAGATQTVLQVTQNGTGDIVDFLDGATSVFKIADGGNVTMNALSFTQTTVNPVHKGKFADSDNASAELDGPNNVFVQGKYAYVASYDDDGVEILDISNPAAPAHVGSITDDATTELDGAYSIFVQGKYAYVASMVDDGVEILDISNPAAPAHIGAITDSTTTALLGASSVYVSGKYAYVTGYGDSGVEILDISNPAAPAHIGAIFDSSNAGTYELYGAFSIYVQGRYAYVASFDDDGVEILDISNPAAPAHIGAITDDATTELDGAEGIYVSGRYAYATGMLDDGVEILDISNPAAPAHIGAITDDATTELDGASSLYIAGKYAYVSGFVDDGVEILDISNPAAPAHIGAITDDATTELDGACAISVSGKYAYVTGLADDGIEVLEVAGFDIPTANIGDLSVSALDVVDNANIANNLYVGNGLNVGQGGIYSAGPLTISQNGSGILMDAIDTGVSIFRINKGSIAITRPLDLQVEGDAGVEYNLNFLSNSVSYINSAGPLTISAGDSNSYENLTLTTAGTGDVIVDISASLYGFRVIGSAGKVFSIDPSGNVVIGGIDSSNADLTVKRNITTQGGNLILNNLATPSSVTVTPVGTTGATTYGYRVSAINGNGETLAAATVSTATGNATLSSTSYNRITWSAVAGATGYKIYGRTASSELYMATVNSPTLYYYDLGTAAPSGALPASNTTGGTINYPASDGPLRTLILQPANATIPTVDGATLNKVDATNSSYWVGDYNDTTNQSVYWSWTMPDSYDGGAIDVTYYWSAASTTGSVVWCFQSQGIATDGSQALDTALGSAACTTSTAAGSADYLISKTQSEATSNYSAGQYVTFKVYRDAASGSDDMTGDARLVKIKIEYHIKSESD